MRYYEAKRTIHAPASKVWEVLVDAPAYTSWDSGIVKVEGTLGFREQLKVYSRLMPNRAFPVVVSELEHAKRMTWTGGMPVPGLFRGRRTFTLAEDGSVTEFHMREEFTGLLLPLMWRMMPDLQPTFDQFADGLKAKAEAAASTV